MSGWALGAAPLAMVLAAVLCRLTEHWMLEGEGKHHDLTLAGRFIVETLSVSGQVLVVAAGLIVGLTWARPW